jgi:hypothetical protein
MIPGILLHPKSGYWPWNITGYKILVLRREDRSILIERFFLIPYLTEITISN